MPDAGNKRERGDGPSPDRAIERRVKQHVIGRKHLFFAVVQPGFEETARRELEEIGIEEFSRPLEGGVEFLAKLDACYRVNIASRTISRLLMRLTSFKAVTFSRFETKISEFPWELHIGDGAPVTFRIRSRGSRLYHEGRLEEELLGGIRARLADHGRTVTIPEDGSGEGPERTAQAIHVRLSLDKCTVSLDTSGGLLYKRGRKPHATPATLRETIAALILREAGWPGFDVLLDPMCGAGTFAIEAAEMLTGRLPNPERQFSFMDWPAFRPAAYRHLKRQLLAKAPGAGRTGKVIHVSDVDPAAVEVARKNLEAAGLVDGLGASALRVEERDFLEPGPAERFPADARCLVVLDPPYGKRLRKGTAEQVFRRIGDALRHRARCGYAVIVPGLELEKVLSLAHDRKIVFMNGGIRVAVIIKYGPEG